MKPPEREIVSGYRLASLGLHVHFRAPTGAKTADAVILGRLWEIKSPTGASRSTIEQAIRSSAGHNRTG